MYDNGDVRFFKIMISILVTAAFAIGFFLGVNFE